MTEIQKQLIAALKSSDIEEFKRIMRLSVDMKDPSLFLEKSFGMHNETWLMLAVASGSYEAVKFLLQLGANPSAVMIDGQGPLDLVKIKLNPNPLIEALLNTAIAEQDNLHVKELNDAIDTKNLPKVKSLLNRFRHLIDKPLNPPAPDTALIKAVKLDDKPLIDFLLSLCPNVSVVDEKGNTALAIAKLSHAKRLESVEKKTEDKIEEKEGSGEVKLTEAEIGNELLTQAFAQRDEVTLLLKKAEARNQFRQAILDRNQKEIVFFTSIYPEFAIEPLDQWGRLPVEFAVFELRKHPFTVAVIDTLLMSGAKLPPRNFGIGGWYFPKFNTRTVLDVLKAYHDVSESFSQDAINSLKAEFSNFNFQSEDVEAKPLKEKQLIVQAVNGLELGVNELNIFQRIDLYCTLNSLLGLLKKVQKLEALKKELQCFFSEREDNTNATGLDYNLSSDITNKICIAVAKIVFDKDSFFNQLLPNSTDLPSPWKSLTDGSSSLPTDPSQFFRDEKNGIHLYTDTVTYALERIKEGYTRWDDIWLKTDARVADQQRPLSIETLGILKQRTPSLAKLIDYTLELTEHSESASYDVQANFYKLRKGLMKGDVNHGGKEELASHVAEEACLKFALWWNNPNLLTPEEKKIIEALRYPDCDYSLGGILNIVLRVTPLPASNADGTPNTTGCIFYRGRDLQLIIDFPANAQKIAEISKAVKERIKDNPTHAAECLTPPTLRFTPTQLDAWKEKIVQELAVTPSHLNLARYRGNGYSISN